jgi:hypothetical protein
LPTFFLPLLVARPAEIGNPQGALWLRWRPAVVSLNRVYAIILHFLHKM